MTVGYDNITLEKSKYAPILMIGLAVAMETAQNGRKTSNIKKPKTI